MDDEHAQGARITLEEGGVTAPWSITCGVYGCMVHTAFFGSEAEAREAIRRMKTRLAEILEATDSARTESLVARFVADF